MVQLHITNGHTLESSDCPEQGYRGGHLQGDSLALLTGDCQLMTLAAIALRRSRLLWSERFEFESRNLLAT